MRAGTVVDTLFSGLNLAIVAVVLLLVVIGAGAVLWSFRQLIFDPRAARTAPDESFEGPHEFFGGPDEFFDGPDEFFDAPDAATGAPDCDRSSLEAHRAMQHG